MLQSLDSEICECYRHAAECSCSAAQSRDKDFLDMERRWLFLARGYEFADRLRNFAEPSNRRNRKRIQEMAFGAPFGSHSNQSDLVDHGLAEKECEYAELV
jgi:hypothetical protein